jgi:hypothetical protein
VHDGIDAFEEGAQIVPGEVPGDEVDLRRARHRRDVVALLPRGVGVGERIDSAHRRTILHQRFGEMTADETGDAGQ